MQEKKQDDETDDVQLQKSVQWDAYKCQDTKDTVPERSSLLPEMTKDKPTERVMNIQCKANRKPSLVLLFLIMMIVKQCQRQRRCWLKVESDEQGIIALKLGDYGYTWRRVPASFWRIFSTHVQLSEFSVCWTKKHFESGMTTQVIQYSEHENNNIYSRSHFGNWKSFCLGKTGRTEQSEVWSTLLISGTRRYWGKPGR